MNKLKQLRETLPYGTLAIIANELGVTQSKVTRVIKGQSKDPDIVIAIVDAAHRVREAEEKLNNF